MKTLAANIKKSYTSFGQKLGTFFISPSKHQGQLALFVVGISLLTVGILSSAAAQTTYNDTRIGNSLNAIFTYIEGSFGAMVMVAAGIGAIFSSAFGQYKAALGLLAVAVGAFILRSLVSTFFNDASITADWTGDGA